MNKKIQGFSQIFLNSKVLIWVRSHLEGHPSNLQSMFSILLTRDFTATSFFLQMDRTDKGWSKPKPLPSIVNSMDGIHWMLSADNQGNLYFGTWNPQEDGKTTGDIYCSKFENGQYARPEKLGPEINVPGYNYSPQGR